VATFFQEMCMNTVSLLLIPDWRNKPSRNCEIPLNYTVKAAL